LFEDLNETGRTIVVITHEPDVGARAKHLVHIYDGLLRESVPVAAGGAAR
jgi:putative ABC transport system ATP-binding protein